MIPNNSLYGNYRQVKFTNVFPDSDAFVTEYQTNKIPQKITNENAQSLYFLLYSRYGNSTIASSDTNQFKYKLWTTVFSYGPAWEKRLELQDKLLALTDDEIQKGNTTIYNHAFNPSTSPSTDTLEEVTYINEQTAQKSKRGKMDAYAYLWDLIDTDVTSQFLDRFRPLFLTIVEPELPLWYKTKLNPDEEDEEQ